MVAFQLEENQVFDLVRQLAPHPPVQIFIQQNFHLRPVAKPGGRIPPARQSSASASRWENLPENRQSNRPLRGGRRGFAPERAYRRTPACRREFRGRSELRTLPSCVASYFAWATVSSIKNDPACAVKIFRALQGFTFKPSAAAAFLCLSSKLKKIFDSKTSAAATCSKSRLRVPSVGVWRSLNCRAWSCNGPDATGVGTRNPPAMSVSTSCQSASRCADVMRPRWT